LRAALPTVNTISDAGGIAILMSHLGRPGGTPNKELTLRPIAQRLSALLDRPVTFIPELV